MGGNYVCGGQGGGVGGVMARHEAGEKGLNHKGPFVPSLGVWIYPIGNEDPLKHFKQRANVIKFVL